MRVIPLTELSQTENVNISSLFAMKQRWQDGRSFAMHAPRRQSAFLWFCGAEGLFSLVGKESLSVPKGSLVYIPEGSVYTITFSNCTEEISTVLVELCLATGNERFVLAPEITPTEASFTEPAVCDVMLRMTSAFSIPERPYLSAMSDAFRLLDLLASASEKRRISKRGFSTIEAGIHYLETDERQALSLDDVAKMCFVTPAYFRRLFRKYAGMSPAEYRAERRMARAVELLEGETLSVAQIAEQLGYESASYFCRVFKQRMGVAPTRYKRKYSIEK